LRNEFVEIGMMAIFHETRQEMDRSLTFAHEVFIYDCNILSRNMAKIGEDSSWRQLLVNNRKKIGDFACLSSLHFRKYGPVEKSKSNLLSS